MLTGAELYDADGDSEESLTYVDPEPGTYTVTVDGYSVPSGSTEFDYVDVFYSSSLGSLDVDETPFTFAGGATKQIEATVTANDVPEAGRELFGELSLESTSGAVLGTASVLIKAVTG